ncbi:MAG: hypothetical protein ACXVO1_11215 [Tumebacillaceae bacterium]
MNVQIPAIIGSVVFLIGAVFQLLLVIGLPLGEYSWGGKYQGVLPSRLRISSLFAALILVLMAFVLLLHTKVISIGTGYVPTTILVWIITIFMGLNTLGNLASKSKKEKLLMTPQTAIACLSCIVILTVGV